MKKFIVIMTLAVVLSPVYAGFAFGAVSPEEAAKLGTTLTRFGAEMAGNKEGTIPPYTGGLTKPPPNFVPGSNVRPDPFENEKPLFSISAQNMNQYADKLTEGTKDLMKKFPTYRIDIYKTHRAIAYPEYILKNTAKNAVKATTYNGGLSIKGAHGGVPFPIPKDGYEVVWNHLTAYQGRVYETKSLTQIVDKSGKRIITGGVYSWQEFPFYDENPEVGKEIFWRLRWYYWIPTRRVGETAQAKDYLNYYDQPRVAYQYLPGQRRVKLAPEIAYDTPSTETCGNDLWDEIWIFNGAMDRYNVKLIGKKEMYVPYNNYRLHLVKAEELFTPKHLNPDFVRWELHRVWIVEMTLKPGKRHVYAKRRLYIDEDSWKTVAGEMYDAHGRTFKVDNLYVTQLYEAGFPCTYPYSHHNFTNDVYAFQFWMGVGEGCYIREGKVQPERWWTPDVMASMGTR